MSETTRTKPRAALLCLDRSGASVSTICAIHCAVNPLMSSLFSLIGLGLLADERAEIALVTTSGLIGAASLWLGTRVHGSRLVAAMLLAGFVLLSSGRLAEGGNFEVFGTLLAVIGGLGIASAHFLSHRCLVTCPAR